MEVFARVGNDMQIGSFGIITLKAFSFASKVDFGGRGFRVSFV
jgi:hypothetical protein